MNESSVIEYMKRKIKKTLREFADHPNNADTRFKIRYEALTEFELKLGDTSFAYDFGVDTDTISSTKSKHITSCEAFLQMVKGGPTIWFTVSLEPKKNDVNAAYDRAMSIV